MSRPLLRIEGLTASYGQAQVLFGINLTLGEGEIVAVMGRNGAGKSTLLKAIMGLVQAHAGALYFAGRSIAGLAPFRIARLGLGYVPEERRIFTQLTVLENLAVAAKPARSARRQPWTAQRLFEIFPNLKDMRARRAGQMSGGEQQMLTIARTLMGNPDAVLLDEPSEGLAPTIMQALLEAVRGMKVQGVSVLLAEQNLAFAAALAERVYIMEKGSIRQQGPMAELVRDAALRQAYLAF
jgi:branched-chain amino acid transport system ATP-binding protein